MRAFSVHSQAVMRRGMDDPWEFGGPWTETEDETGKFRARCETDAARSSFYPFLLLLLAFFFPLQPGPGWSENLWLMGIRPGVNGT
jgi:hypothetical protein